MKKRSEKQKNKKLFFEIKRKSLHLLASFYILLYWCGMKLFGHQIALLILVSTLIIFVIVEFFRLVEHQKIPIFHVFWRAKEENSLGGQVYYILGLIIALAVFDFDIAFAVALMTTFGDMSAAIFGITLGKHKIKKLNKKTWEGVFAEFAVDILIGFFIFHSWIIIIPTALTASIVETIFPHIDDNLAIPVFAGFVGQCIKLIQI
jgi:phytol kinase